MRQGHKDRQMMGEGTGTVYRLVVRSELSDRYAVAFEEMKMETKDGGTILTGEVIDQPHLFGILDRINGLGLELVSVWPYHKTPTRVLKEIESQSHDLGGGRGLGFRRGPFTQVLAPIPGRLPAGPLSLGSPSVARG
jgi:hypothetical protein